MAEPVSVGNEGLVRVIGAGALGLSVVNMVVGAGIFVLPGRIAAELGSAAILAYLVCSVAVALVFLCFAEIGSRTTRSGGAYAYIEEAFGPFAGFIASILFWFGYSALADAAITVAMVEAMTIAFPVLGESLPRAAFIVALFVFLAVVNIKGVEAGVRLYVFNTVAKLIPLLLLLAAGLFAIKTENLAIPEWPSVRDIGAGAIMLFFAFTGAECALNASGEIKNPSKTVPMGLMIGIGGLVALYVGCKRWRKGCSGRSLRTAPRRRFRPLRSKCSATGVGRCCSRASSFRSMARSAETCWAPRGSYSRHRWTTTCRASCRRSILSTRRRMWP